MDVDEKTCSFGQTVLHSAPNELYDIISDIINEIAEIAIAIGKGGREEFVVWVNTAFPIGLRVQNLPEEDDVEKFIDVIFYAVKKT